MTAFDSVPTEIPDNPAEIRQVKASDFVSGKQYLTEGRAVLPTMGFQNSQASEVLEARGVVGSLVIADNSTPLTDAHSVPTMKDEPSEKPANAEYDKHGNLTRYTIGVEGHPSDVQVAYEDPQARPPVIHSLTIDRRTDGKGLHDKDITIKPSTDRKGYTYEVAGVPPVEVDQVRIDHDGRIHVFLGKDGKGMDREVVSIDPKTGKLIPSLNL